MRVHRCLVSTTCRLLQLRQTPAGLSTTYLHRKYSLQKPAMPARRKLIVDVDTGVDDAQALMLGLGGGADILAVTCVAGNTHVDQVITNTLRVLQACDRLDVPVYKGAKKSILGSHEDSIYHHGEDGLGGQPDPTPPSREPLQSKPAAIAMIDIVNKYPGEVTLVALAPLTNVALAVRLDPDFGSKLKNAVIMGGNIKGRGRMTPCADFNFFMDPESALVTLTDLQCPISIITYEISRECGLSWEWFDELMNVDTKKGKFHRKINEYTRKRRKEVLNLPAYISCDPIAMAVALDESLILSSEKHYCAVELQGQLTRGQMVVDWKGQLKKKANVDIVMKVDLDKLRGFYEQMVK